MKKTLALTFTIVGIVLTVGAVAAQQPRPTATPVPTEKVADKTAAVLAALKGVSPAAPEPLPVESPSSLSTVLDRYSRMAAAGQQAPAASTGAAPRVTTMPVKAGTATTTGSGSPVAASNQVTDTLDGILAELRALLVRLDALAHKGGGR